MDHPGVPGISRNPAGLPGPPPPRDPKGTPTYVRTYVPSGIPRYVPPGTLRRDPQESPGISRDPQEPITYVGTFRDPKGHSTQAPTGIHRDPMEFHNVRLSTRYRARSSATSRTPSVRLHWVTSHWALSQQRWPRRHQRPSHSRIRGQDERRCCSGRRVLWRQ